MTLTQLEYILAVEKERNFHRAAKACYVTQPTLSTLIKNLEEELDVVIFDRSKKPTAPTKLGQVILDQARLALLEINKIHEAIHQQRGTIKGELKIGIIPTIAPYLTPLFLRSFKSSHKEVNLSISELTTENCLGALDNDNIDLAILATQENKAKYFQTHLYDEKMLAFIHPDHPLHKRKQISVDDLIADDMWLLEDGHCLRDEIVKLCHLRRVENKRPLGFDLKVGSLESLRLLVQENFGYTLLPELSTLRISSQEKKLLKTLSKPEPKRSIFLTTRRKFLKEAMINALKIEIINAVKAKL